MGGGGDSTKPHWRNIRHGAPAADFHSYVVCTILQTSSAEQRAAEATIDHLVVSFPRIGGIDSHRLASSGEGGCAPCAGGMFVRHTTHPGPEPVMACTKKEEFQVRGVTVRTRAYPWRPSHQGCVVRPQVPHCAHAGLRLAVGPKVVRGTATLSLTKIYALCAMCAGEGL